MYCVQRLDDHNKPIFFEGRRTTDLIHRINGLIVLICLVSAGVLWHGTGYAQLNKEKPDAVKSIGIKEKLGDKIPSGITLVDSKGDTVKMGELLRQDKPVLINPGYYECPQLCSLIRTGVFKAARDMNWTPGQEYTIVSFSFDSAETANLADSVKNHYISRFDRNGIEKGWYFLTGSSDQIRRLTQSIGFGFKYDKSKDQYAHRSAIIFASPEGKITRYLYGIQYETQNVKNALYEAADGEIGNTVERIVLSCYQYSPKEGSYVPMAFRIMKLGGIATAIILGGFLSIFWYRERVKKKKQA